ncbi:MAG: acyl-CoA dehydrogenase family protein [Pseudomonadota bacterium]
MAADSEDDGYSGGWLEARPDLEAFRDEVRDFIRTHLPDDIRRLVATELMELPREYQLRWQRILYERGGWGCPNWPKAHGGPGWSFEQQYIFEREAALADAPRVPSFGVSMLGPTLIEYGTPEQKARFLPPILKGEVLWCQGFSEPNAGSDLASLKTRAVREDDHYVIDGTKIWTTEANIADWMFGLFRTDSSGKKQQGITFLMLDMKTPGISIRPIRTFDGGHEVNQVFFDKVRVPVENRVGEEHRGWGIGKYLLSLERFGIAEVSRSLATLARVKAAARRPLADGTRLLDDPGFAQRLAAAEIRLKALESLERRFLFGPGGPEALGPEASILKIMGTEVQQGLLELLVDATGLGAAPDLPAEGQDEPPLPPEARFAARAFFNMRKTSIYGGSNEIQKNILTKAVLGLE